jgi:hypothetical protein
LRSHAGVEALAPGAADVGVDVVADRVAELLPTAKDGVESTADAVTPARTLPKAATYTPRGSA